MEFNGLSILVASFAVLIVAVYLLTKPKKKKVRAPATENAEKRVLECFTATEKHMYYDTKTISSKCKYSPAHTLRILAQLTEKGVLVSKKDGRRILYAKKIVKDGEVHA